jgi:hypothetical protein
MREVRGSIPRISIFFVLFFFCLGFVALLPLYMKPAHRNFTLFFMGVRCENPAQELLLSFSLKRPTEAAQPSTGVPPVRPPAQPHRHSAWARHVGPVAERVTRLRVGPLVPGRAWSIVHKSTCANGQQTPNHNISTAASAAAAVTRSYLKWYLFHHPST